MGIIYGLILAAILTLAFWVIDFQQTRRIERERRSGIDDNTENGREQKRGINMHTWTTLKELRDAGACKDRYDHLIKALGKKYGDNTPIDLVTILETNGLTDVLWIPEKAVSGDFVQRRYRLFAVACRQHILHLMDDHRSRDAVRVAHLYAYGETTDTELDAARAAAWDAAWDKFAEHFKVIFSADYGPQ